MANLFVKMKKKRESKSIVLASVIFSLLIASLLGIILVSWYMKEHFCNIIFLILLIISIFIVSLKVALEGDYAVGYNMCNLPEDLIDVEKYAENSYCLTIKRAPAGYIYCDGYDSNEVRHFYLARLRSSYEIWDMYKYKGDISKSLSYEEYKYLAMKGEEL